MSLAHGRPPVLHLLRAAQCLLRVRQLAGLGLQLSLKLLQLVTLLLQLGHNSVTGAVGGAVGLAHPCTRGHTGPTFISDCRFTCSIWKASCSFTRAAASWLCCVTVSCLAVSAFCRDGQARIMLRCVALRADGRAGVGTYLPEQLSVRVDQLTVLLLQLAVARLGGARLPCARRRQAVLEAG